MIDKVARATRLVRNAAENLEESAIALADIEGLEAECVLSASASNLIHNLYSQLDTLLAALEEKADEEQRIPLQQALKVPAEPLTENSFIPTPNDSLVAGVLLSAGN